MDATAYVTDNQPTEPTNDALPIDVELHTDIDLTLDNTTEPVEIQVSF
jgi:hypothetical protein